MVPAALQKQIRALTADQAERLLEQLPQFHRASSVGAGPRQTCNFKGFSRRYATGSDSCGRRPRVETHGYVQQPLRGKYDEASQPIPERPITKRFLPEETTPTI